MNNHGGARKNSGAKQKYKEATLVVSFRVPVSQINQVKNMVIKKLRLYESKANKSD